MLKGIHPAIGPELLKVLAEMGHGDEIILADAHFPGHSVNDKVLRADGVKITTLLDGILPLFELTHDNPLIMMQAVDGDSPTRRSNPPIALRSKNTHPMRPK